MRQELIAARVGELGDEPFGPEFCKVVTKRGEGIAFGRAANRGDRMKLADVALWPITSDSALRRFVEIRMPTSRHGGSEPHRPQFLPLTRKS